MLEDTKKQIEAKKKQIEDLKVKEKEQAKELQDKEK